MNADVFRLLVQNVADYAILLLDPEGRVVNWNAGAERISGYAAGEVVGTRVEPPELLEHAARDGHVEHAGWRLRKDGSRFWASVAITALRNPDGGLLGFSSITRDATVEHGAELANERLAAMQRLLEAALAHLSLDDLLHELLERITDLLHVDTAAILLREGDVLVVRAARGLDERQGRNVRIPMGVGLAGRIAAERQPVILEDVPHAVLPNPMLRQQGLTSIMGVPLLIDHEVLGVVHVGSLAFRRFTEDDVQLLQLVADRVALAIEHARLLEAERAARAEATEAGDAIRLRDEFLSIAAHELKTPITSLLGSAQLLTRRMEQADLGLDTRTRDRVRTIESQAKRLGHLVSQLLDVSRVQAGRLMLDRRPTDVAELTRSVVSGLGERDEAPEIVVRGPEHATASIDALRIEQVLTNLLTNALKYGPREQPILVDIQPDPGTLKISVRDFGPGIPRQRRRGLFDRFYQARAGDYRSGMGLGLYISRQIVEQHGGHIEAQFPNDGGTRLVVVLPVE
jgi:PAS domain S-box-containing protein